MEKNILVYRWGSDMESVVVRNLRDIGMTVVECDEKFSDNHADAGFVQKVLALIQSHGVQLVFSMNYFPLLASVCEMSGIPYASWICDCPWNALMSKTVLYKHNYFFCFDRICADKLAALGCENVYHFPLAVDVTVFDEVLALGKEAAEKYAGDISLVGSFDSKRDGWLEKDEIPEYVKGYLNGIVEAQLRVYGYNFVKEMIGRDVAEDIIAKTGLTLGEMYFYNPVQLAADYVNEEVTRREQIDVIEAVSKAHEINLYTDSRYEGNGYVRLCGTVDYRSQMPLAFQNSRINLNITPKAVESGIPLQVLDILACGGFCLTNYQPEIAEYFEDGVELVMYTDMEDLRNKVSWYLQHEEERAVIARAGRKKVEEEFVLKRKLTEMLELFGLTPVLL